MESDLGIQDKLMNPLVLKRILRKGGVLRTSKGVHTIMSRITHEFITRILHACILVATQGNKKTVTHASLKTACSLLGIKLAVGINPTAHVTPSLTTGPSYRKKSKTTEEGEPKKRRKSKQGKASAREVVFQQKLDKLVFRKLTFSKYCKSISRDTSSMIIVSKPVDLESLRWSKSVFPVIQVICERYLVAIATSAWNLVINTNHKTIKSEHIQSVLGIMENCGPYMGFW